MKTEIVGTFKWSKEQVEVYAAAFRDKDAAYVKGYGWDKVAQVYNEEGFNCVPYSLGTTNVDKYINSWEMSWEMRDGKPWRGHPEDFEESCEIVTPKDYEVQEGDKLVWLGRTQKQGKHSEYTFGKVYKVERHGDRLIYKDDMNLSILARTEKDRWKYWGVIPKWENIKGDKGVMSEGFKFNIGDEVRIVEDDSLYPHERKYIGSKAKIVKVDYDYYPYAVDIPGADDYVWFTENALELADKNTPSERPAEHQALDYLLSRVGTKEELAKMKEELAKEVIEWAKYYLEELDFGEVKKAIGVAEKLVGERLTEE